MADSKLRPADVVANAVILRSYADPDCLPIGEPQTPVGIIEADRAAVRAEAEAAGYQRAVRELVAKNSTRIACAESNAETAIERMKKVTAALSEFRAALADADD
jgi:hypothetical protein